MPDQWHEGPELTLHAGLSVEEIRACALQAAASSWAGISAMGNRDAAILRTAETFQTWLTAPQHRGEDNV